MKVPGAARPLNVNLRQMRAFVAIGRLGSFTQAAKLLHTTQPALSARIRELESALAVRLFDRSTRSVQLTQAGEDLLPVVEQVLSEHPRDEFAQSSDLLMAALARGRERTLPEYDALFRGSGLRVTRRTALPTGFTAFELAAAAST